MVQANSELNSDMHQPVLMEEVFIDDIHRLPERLNHLMMIREQVP